jgi:RNA polymerase sigma-70 factor (ECF subfamily)
MGDSGLATRHSVGPARPPGLDDGGRLRALIDEHFDFVWRTLRRLGVPPSDLDDATQQVFLVVSRKLSLIDIEREKAFVFQTALRVAADARRTLRRRREVLDGSLFERVDGAPGPEDVADRKRARAMLDAVLEDMPIDLRVVFILFEVEELSSIEIGRLLGVPTGTVASRLRRARADFQARVAVLEKVDDRRGDSR